MRLISAILHTREIGVENRARSIGKIRNIYLYIKPEQNTLLTVDKKKKLRQVSNGLLKTEHARPF